MLHVFKAEVDARAVADAKASGHTNSLGRQRSAATRKPKEAAKRASTCRPIAINLVANCERTTLARGRNSSKSLTDERKKMAVTRYGWFLCACAQSNADRNNYAAMAPTGRQALDRHGKRSARPTRAHVRFLSCRESPLHQASRSCELNHAPTQLTFTANTTCPVEAGLSEPVNDH